MSKSIVRLVSGLLIMLVIIGGLAACSSEPESEPAYAGQMTENSLQAMSDCDYTAYLENFTPEAQVAITEDLFNTACQEIKALIGDYIDKEFWRATTQDGYTIVDYTANFSEEPDEVIVSVYFEEIDGEMYMAGFWLDSPKLRGSAESIGE